MARSTFWERFEYAIWIRHLRTGAAPSYVEIGRAAGGLTGQGVSNWKGREKPPTNYELHKPLADFFQVPQEWLISDVGDPPRPELWTIWRAERSAPTEERTADGIGDKLTGAELVRASRKAESERRQPKPRSAKKPQGRRGGSA